MEEKPGNLTFLRGLHKVCSHIMVRSDLLCRLYKVCSHIMARSDLLCRLYKVCSHIMVRSDLFLCPREWSVCHVVSHICTHCGLIFKSQGNRNFNTTGLL